MSNRHTHTYTGVFKISTATAELNNKSELGWINNGSAENFDILWCRFPVIRNTKWKLKLMTESGNRRKCYPQLRLLFFLFFINLYYISSWGLISPLQEVWQYLGLPSIVRLVQTHPLALQNAYSHQKELLIAWSINSKFFILINNVNYNGFYSANYTCPLLITNSKMPTTNCTCI